MGHKRRNSEYLTKCVAGLAVVALAMHSAYSTSLGLASKPPRSRILLVTVYCKQVGWVQGKPSAFL